MESSLPSRERGLKYCICLILIKNHLSLPSRERGLKSLDEAQYPCFLNVAPLAGAWIEIIVSGLFCTAYVVAPLAGAWIEIICREFNVSEDWVAPLAGAWIEMKFPFAFVIA